MEEEVKTRFEEAKTLLENNAIAYEVTKAGSIKFYVNVSKHCYRPKTNILLKWRKTVKNNDLLDDGLAHLKVILDNILTDEEIEQQNVFKTIDNGDEYLNWGKYIYKTIDYVHKTDINYLKFMLRLVRELDNEAYDKYRSTMNEHQYTKLNRLLTEFFYKLEYGK